MTAPTGTLWTKFRYEVVPPLFLVFFTNVVHVLALYGQGAPVTLAAVFGNLAGNAFSWRLVSSYFVWALLWLKLPSAEFCGPPPPSGREVSPVYKDNGVAYYAASVGVTLVAYWARPSLFTEIYLNTPQMLGALNLAALALCLGLYLKGRLRPDDPASAAALPPLYLFYRGIDLHPRLGGVDVKQLTNCRIGVMGWQLLVLAYFLAGVNLNGFSFAAFAGFFIQSVYLGMFFVWETGYFDTLDMTLDRAGYYLCWGCLVWVPCLYTYSTYLTVASPPTLPAHLALPLALLGTAAVLIKCRVDYEKTWFKQAGSGDAVLWGKKADYIEAEYVDARGEPKKTRLLTSGCWGLARHLNYTMELASTLSWSLPAASAGLPAFFYLGFLAALLLHRVFRDEEKCAAKYGPAWTLYCRRVPARLVPYLF